MVPSSRFQATTPVQRPSGSMIRSSAKYSMKNCALCLQRLAVERVQDGMARAVGGGAGALHGRALAIIHHVAAERPLVDLAFLGARERNAVMLEFVDRCRRLARHVLHGVDVAQPVRPLDGVEHVPLPAVGPHVLQGGGDAALGRDRVRPRREDLGDAGGLQALLGHAERGAQPRAAGADDDDVELVIDIGVGGTGLCSSATSASECQFEEREGARAADRRWRRRCSA